MNIIDYIVIVFQIIIRPSLTSNDTSEKIDKNFPCLCPLPSGIENAQLFMTIRRQIDFVQTIILLAGFSTKYQS